MPREEEKVEQKEKAEEWVSLLSSLSLNALHVITESIFLNGSSDQVQILL